MTNAGTKGATFPGEVGAAPRRAGLPFQMRFAAIWIALAALLATGRLLLPASVELATLLSILPFAAFLTCATMGQTIVIMGRGIDLSPPAIIALSSTVLLGVSGGHDDRMWLAIGAALLAALAVGAVNGLLVGVLKLNALIVTLSTGRDRYRDYALVSAEPCGGIESASSAGKFRRLVVLRRAEQRVDRRDHDDRNSCPYEENHRGAPVRISSAPIRAQLTRPASKSFATKAAASRLRRSFTA